jgi:hypothetical protein
MSISAFPAAKMISRYISALPALVWSGSAKGIVF